MNLQILREFFARVTCARYLNGFDRSTLDKGARLMRDDAVALHRIRELKVTGKVRSSDGQRSYVSSLEFDSNQFLMAECSCPLGGDCKHCAAVLLELVRWQAADPHLENTPAAPAGADANRCRHASAAARSASSVAAIAP